MILSRLRVALFMVPVAAALAACGNNTARAPNPTRYEWPDSFAYRIVYVSGVQGNGRTLLRFVESKRLNVLLRDQQYLAWHDSVLKTSHIPGGLLSALPHSPEDTLVYYLRLGRYGEVADVQLGCDPAVPQCADALPSLIRLELRKILPRLSVWQAPRGGWWVDTLSWDDAPRPRGERGTVVTTYTAARDTTIAGRGYWMVGWTSVRQAFRRADPRGPAGMLAETSVRETGVSFVDKRRLLPVYSTWAGAVTIAEQLRALGATAEGFRGRAYLVGTRFDSVFAQEGIER